MALYGFGATRTGNTVADTPLFALRLVTATTRPKILQIIIAVAVAPASAPVFYLTRTTTTGTTPVTNTALQMDPAEATSLCTFDSGWATAPAITAANKLSIGALGVTAGGAWVWTFPDDLPLTIPATIAAGVSVVNATASASGGTFTCSMLWRE